MAEVSTGINFIVRFTEQEYNLMTKALAHLAGVEGARWVDADKVAVQQLNLKLLDQQEQDLREKLAVNAAKKKQAIKP